MIYYRTCPYCGDHLDPGERCTCQDEKKTAPGATNTQSGNAGKVLSDLIPASSLDENEEDCQV